MRFQLVARTGHPDFLDLPWDRPLEDWQHDRLVEVPRGLHRHVVRFVQYLTDQDDRLYVLKELPRKYAEREYRFLRHLADEGVPVVDVVGVVANRTDAQGESLPAVLITEHLRVVAALPAAVRTSRGVRAARADAGRPGGPAGAHPPRRLRVGRLLVVQHAVPA